MGGGIQLREKATRLLWRPRRSTTRLSRSIRKLYWRHMDRELGCRLVSWATRKLAISISDREESFEWTYHLSITKYRQVNFFVIRSWATLFKVQRKEARLYT